MKIILKFFAIFLLSSISFSCNVTQDSYQDSYKENSEEDKNEPTTIQYDSLADFLHRQPGLDIMGTGNNVKVLIRGINTIKLGTEPLYVIDNIPIGNSYVQANNAVNPHNIDSVRVLKGASAMTIYGENSRNGVILIKTKKIKKLEEEEKKNKKNEETEKEKGKSGN